VGTQPKKNSLGEIGAGSSVQKKKSDVTFFKGTKCEDGGSDAAPVEGRGNAPSAVWHTVGRFQNDEAGKKVKRTYDFLLSKRRRDPTKRRAGKGVCERKRKGRDPMPGTSSIWGNVSQNRILLKAGRKRRQKPGR